MAAMFSCGEFIEFLKNAGKQARSLLGKPHTAQGPYGVQTCSKPEKLLLIFKEDQIES